MIHDKRKIFGRLMPYIIITVTALYTLAYYNYFETPSADYIGNFMPRVLEYMEGFFPGNNFKILPLYPLLLGFFTKLNKFQSFDPIYITAITLNYVLLIPYLVLTYRIFTRFLPEKMSIAALFFLCINGYTVYTAVNAELEMLLSFLIVLSFYLIIENKKSSYFTAFLAAFTKWDAVFIIPAVMFKDFFYNKHRIKSIILGFFASLGFLTWMLLGLIPKFGSANPYVNEIAERGPNIYRYLVDTFLVSSGFVQWMAGHVYLSKIPFTMKVLILILPAAAIIILISATLYGVFKLIKEKPKEILPLIIFYGGFIFIHMVYRNTKSRYVLPVLWIQYLFIFYALSRFNITRISRKIAEAAELMQKKPVALYSILVLGAVIFIGTEYAMYAAGIEWYLLLFSFVLVLVIANLFSGGYRKNKPVQTYIFTLLIAVLCNINIFYTSQMMDHYSLRRVEFKKAALWYKENKNKHDIMLITETNVAEYYSGFSRERFIKSSTLKSSSINELIHELNEKNISLIFIDDFYIKRLRMHDKNALDKKAPLLRDLRDNYIQYKNFSLVKIFKTGDSITSYLLKYSP